MAAREDNQPSGAAARLSERLGHEPPRAAGAGHYTGRCGSCGSGNLWHDNGAYGCSSCGAMWCGWG